MTITDSTPITKDCTKCGNTKPLDEFYLDTRRKDGGRRASCKQCKNKQVDTWRDENKEHVNAQARLRSYTERNRELHRERMRRYRQRHPEKKRAENALYRARRKATLQSV